MKLIILVLTLIFISSSEIVRPKKNECTCDKIKSQADCKTLSSCKWTPAVPATANTIAISGSCGTSKTTTTPTVASAHCLQVTEPATNCWKTLGCAYIENQCTHFTGCTAYVKTSNSECQAISKLCITDGIQCVNAKSCNEYLNEGACKINVSISGIFRCKWDKSICRDYTCKDADSTLNTNADCNAWLSGCMTTGKGCIGSLGNCSSYIGNDVACSGLRGIDGYCVGTPGGTNCTALACNKAAATLVTDFQCEAYQLGCITTGKGCTTSPLPPCSSYTGDDSSCLGYIGSDGICEGDHGATQCRSRICTNAPTLYNTDQLCSTYKNGCITTGKGCNTSKRLCEGYSGTIQSCIGYIGSDGYCEGSDDTISSPCVTKVCSKAPSTASTDQACEQYQKDCISTGKGCTTTLGRCSSYSGTNTTCEGYIGKDGNCKGTLADIDGPCTPKICTEAPKWINTNQACATYQIGCVTNGFGCISQLGCLDTVQEISCQGTPNCAWNNICVLSKQCSDFLTVSICNGNNSNFSSGSTTQTPCYWTGQFCRNLTCTDAPVTHNTDSLCNSFLEDCLTNGLGCLAPQAPCSEYLGDRKTCSAFTRKCWNLENALTTASCNERVCDDDIYSITDLACDSFKSGCRTKGSGCIDPQTLCSGYSGTQNECDAFKGNNGQTRCWALSTTTPSSCLDKTCTHSAIVHSNEECETFLSGCLYNGAGCVPKSSTCSSYIGTQSECSTFKGTNQTKICWSLSAYITGRCIEKECYHAPTITNSDADCEYFLTGCLTNGSGCVPDSTPCTSFTGTLTECEKYVGNGLPCYNKDACTDKLCSDKLNPQNNDDCQNYLSTCRYFNGTCVNAGPCQFYSGTSLELCQDVLDIAHTKCWWISGSKCISRSCSTVPNTVTNQFGCDAHILNCMYAGTGICVPKGSCDQYPANGASQTDKLMNCQAMLDKNGKSCFYTRGASCESKTCLNVPGTIIGIESCNSHVSGCTFNGTACISIGSCFNYSTIIMNNKVTNQEIRSQCQSMNDQDGNACWYVDYDAYCSSKKCLSITSIDQTSQETCDAYLAGCKFSQPCAKKVCSGKTNAANNNDCTSWMPSCRYIGGNSCIDSAPTCNYNLDVSVTQPEIKQKICESITDNNAGKCQYIEAAQACQARTCDGKADARSQADCTNWMQYCRWIGGLSNCVNSSSICRYTLTISLSTEDKSKLCRSITNTQNEDCQESEIAGSCEPKSCDGKRDAQSQADCTAWIADCWWLGRNGQCVPSQPQCQNYWIEPSVSQTICNSIRTTFGGACQESWPGSSYCETRNCYSKTDALSQKDCTAWMADCRWLGRDGQTGFCVPSDPNCFYWAESFLSPTEKNALCNSITSTSGEVCQESATSGFCEPRNCYSKRDAYSQADCMTWMNNCRFRGYGQCIPSERECYYYQVEPSVSESICNSITTTTGTACKEEWPGRCEPKSCEYIRDPQSQVDCTEPTGYCWWLGWKGQNCMNTKLYCEHYSIEPSQTQTICNSVRSIFEGYCQERSPGSCEARTCYGKRDAQSQLDCTTWMVTCRWVGGASTQCQNSDTFCAYTLTSSLSTAEKTALCTSITSEYGRSCEESEISGICQVRTCAKNNRAKSQADCTKWLAGCKWLGGTNCVAPGACSTYIISNSQDNANQIKICLALTDSGAQCMAGPTFCEKRTCKNLLNPTSNINCIDWLSSCRFTGSYCVTEGSCSSYNVSTGSDSGNRAICEGIKNASGVLCAYVNSQTNCSERTCSLLSIVDQSNCNSWLGTSCRWDGTQCLAGGACNSYSAIGSTDNLKQSYCMTMTDTSDPPLNCNWTSGLYCIEKNCFNVFPIPITDSDCQTYLLSCRLTNTSPVSCVPKTYQCSQYMGTAAQCKHFKGVNDTIPCWSIAVDSAPAAACIDQQCNHNIIATTNVECNSFLPNCKTNGRGCVNSSTSCSTFEGNASICAQRISRDGINFCKVTTSVSHACTLKSCYDDGSSTTDASCQAFMDDCVTRGIGCVPNTEPCSTYQGNQAVCSTFTGNFKKCWNADSADSFTYCVDRKCQDDQKSTTDDTCKSFLNGCLTKGVGCIEDSAPCWVYQGTQATCSGFKGKKKMTPCWNVSSAISNTPCIEKACFHNTTSTSDSDCESFLPRAIRATFPKCVTSGNGCVDYPRTCSGFAGTTEQCGKFTAADGPCKTTATGACTPRICTEALNSYNTDALCKQFHPSCVTNGYGCATSVSCPTIKEKNSCIAKTGCSLVSNCQNIKANCSALTIAGASICVNTPVSSGSTKCAWYNNACRAQTCEDLPATLTSHDQCQAVISICTTTGSGCITMTTCKAYATEIICKAARSTNIGNTCIWDIYVCRARQCTDAPLKTLTDSECDTYLTGCKTNGISCVASVTCSSLLTATACQVDEYGRPCLYINGLCYDFANCEDINKTTHSACQQFSAFCTTNGQNCIAINACANTILQISCVIGTDGSCGWLTANEASPAKCQKFGTCSDSQGTDNASCIAYGSNCITDGINCIEKSICSSYHTQIACDNGGTDGICQFTSNFCRLRECSDAKAVNHRGGVTSNFGCQEFMAKTNCVTDGTSCIAEQECASYLGEIECSIGIDGQCVYDLPTKTCRVKGCEDFKLTTNAACSVINIDVKLGTECVSDGKKCIVKAACSSYTSKSACNGGGSDGQCAFIPGSPITINIGICRLMNDCTDANQDWMACNANSLACNWQVFKSGNTTTTACTAHNCATKASGTNCLPVPSFDLNKYTICGPSSNGCIEVEGNSLSSSTCQSYTMNTFTWDETTAQCTACFTQIDGGVESITIHGKFMNISIMTTLLILSLVV